MQEQSVDFVSGKINAKCVFVHIQCDFIPYVQTSLFLKEDYTFLLKTSNFWAEAECS